MAKLTWDGIGQRIFHYGVSKGVLYLYDDSKKKWLGEAWNGLTTVNDSPDGGDAEEKYADNILYASIRGIEKYAGSVEAFTTPDGWDECVGYKEVDGLKGVTVGQQIRRAFGFSYREEIGHDQNSEAGYKVHVVYNCTASAAEISHDTIEDTVDFEPLSYDFESVPVNITGMKPASHLVFNSLKTPAAAMKALEDALYGTESEEAYLPLPDELFALMKAAVTNGD